MGRSIFSKRYILSFAVLIFVYLIFCPAPENCESPFIVGLVQSTIRLSLSVGFWLAYDTHLHNFSILKANSPTEIHPEVEHFIVQRPNYELHFFKPKNIEPFAGAVVNIHGGGWTLGSVSLYYQFYSNMALQLGSFVVSPEYRLGPDDIFPGASDDCADAIKYISDNAEHYRINYKNIVVTGDSAGGHLSIVSSIVVSEEYDIKVKGIVPVYPVTQSVYLYTPSYINNSHRMLSVRHVASMMSTYIMGNKDVRDKLINNEILKPAIDQNPKIKDIFELADIQLDIKELENQKLNGREQLLLDWKMSVLFAGEEKLKRLPKTIIYVCEHDLLLDDGILMYKRLKNVGLDVEIVQWDGAVHGHLCFGNQFAPWAASGYDLVPKATQQVAEYFNRLETLLN